MMNEETIANKTFPVIPWAEIDTVLLDMDGTILDLGFDNFFWQEYLPKVYAETQQLTLEQSKAALANKYKPLEGKLEWYCLDHWSEQLNIDIAGLKYELKHKVSFRPGAIEFLDFLQRQNKTVILATNAHPKTLEIKMLNVEFSQYFNSLSSSHEFGYPKEEQAYWLALKSKYQFNPERTMFVDDSVRILSAAKKFGIEYCFGISQPDLGKAPIDTSPFSPIHDYLEIIE